jgi:hypothetical protein
VGTLYGMGWEGSICPVWLDPKVLFGEFGGRAEIVKRDRSPPRRQWRKGEDTGIILGE